MQAAKLGWWSALSLFLVSVAYAGVLMIGVRQAGLSDPIVDPVLAIMEALTVVSALLFVVVVAALHACAPAARRIWSRIALIFAGAMATLTSAVHFVALSAGRQLGRDTLEWPSVSYAVELLAWDVFLGLSLIFAAQAVGGADRRAHADSLGRWTRFGMRVAGAACLAGTIGPLIGDMRWQVIGIAGYAVVLPGVTLLLAFVFRRG